MAYFVAIPGTHAWRGGSPTSKDWYHCESPFCAFLKPRGLEPLYPERPFIWSTDLDGHRFWAGWFGQQKRLDWEAAGVALWAYLQPPMFGAAGASAVPPAPLYTHRNLIAHSHGLQVVLYACAAGLKVRRLVSIASPVRQDLIDEGVVAAARKNIERWCHVHSDGGDRLQWLGTIGDGVLRITRKHPGATENTYIPGVGHSRLLTDSTQYGWWDTAGLVPFLRDS